MKASAFINLKNLEKPNIGVTDKAKSQQTCVFQSDSHLLEICETKKNDFKDHFKHSISRDSISVGKRINQIIGAVYAERVLLSAAFSSGELCDSYVGFSTKAQVE